MKIRIVLILLAVSVLLCIAARVPNDATPTFFARRDYTPPGSGSVWVNVFDTNGDGIPDIVGTSVRAAVLLGNGDGTFRTGPRSEWDIYTQQTLAADMNGDGNTDLVLAGPAGVGISFSNGDGTFQPAVFYPVADTATVPVVIGDFDGDGIADVATQGGQGIWLFTGKGGGVLNPGVLIPYAVTRTGPITLWAADFNGDHKCDLLAATSTGFLVFLGNGNGTFQAPQPFNAPFRPVWLTVGDVNSDGNPDVLLPYGRSVYLYLGNGSGGFSALCLSTCPAGL